MIFHDVKLPNSVSIAMQTRELVIFVGAGISYPPPSSFPLFYGLVKQVGKEFGLEANLEEFKDNEPQKLEEWKQAGHKVHAAVAKILRDQNSKPTQLHFNLIKVFPDIKSLRIVTTNFDNHLSTAAKVVFGSNEVKEYFAPALPLGDDFSGIVYLHGSSFKREDRMVLTASDFGKAYFSRGWAREFLLSLFSKYTVLFVGYSHSDVMVSYLAYGIKHAIQKERWALISSDSSEDENERWERLGINTETYPLDEQNESNPHHILSDFFKAWSKYLKQTKFEQINSLKLTIKSGIPDDSVSIELVDFFLKEPSLAQVFCNSIEEPGWIEWMDSNCYFQSLFNDKKDLQDWNKTLVKNERVLGDWLCSTARTKFGEELLALFERHNCELNNEFASIFAFCLWRDNNATDDPKFNTWVGLLVFNHAYAIQPIIWAYILKKCTFPNNAGVALKILDRITSPKLFFEKPIFFLDEDEANVEIVYDIQWPRKAGHWLKQIWESVFRPAVPQWGTAILQILVQQLTYAHLLLRGSGTANKRSDITSQQRESIEPHEQNGDDLNPCLHFLVDALREILIQKSKNPNDELQFYIDEWSASDVPLLIRFSIYAFGLSKSVSDDQKIEWLVERQFLHELEYREEVFFVLKRTYPNVKKDVRIAFIDAIKKSRQNNDLDHRTQANIEFKILTRLGQLDENCEIIKTAIEEIKEDHPEFETWTSGQDSLNPREEVDYSKILLEPPSKFLRLLLNKEGTSFRDYWDLSGVLMELFGIDRGWAEDFVDELQAVPNGVDTIWSSTFFALNDMIKSEDDWRWILGVIESLPESRENFSISVKFLVRNLWNKNSEKNKEIVERCYSIISRAWNLCRAQETESEVLRSDSLDTATNHLGGMISEFWIHYAFFLKHKMGSNWNGLPDSIKGQLNQAIDGNSKTEIYARIAIVPWAAHLYYWDREYSMEHVIPLFNWDFGSDRAKQTWAVYMRYQRLEIIDMEKVLIPHYVQTVNQLVLDSEWEKFLNKKGALHEFGFQIARLFVRVVENPIHSGLVAKLIPKLPEAATGSFVIGIGDFLKVLNPEEQTMKWNSWISEFLENRFKGIPRNFTESELRHLPEWSLNLNDLFPEMVSFLEKLPLKNVFAYSHITDISDSELLEQFPEDACKFCVLVLKAEDYPYLHGQLMELLDKFEQLIPDNNWLEKYKEELLRRGWNPED